MSKLISLSFFFRMGSEVIFRQITEGHKYLELRRSVKINKIELFRVIKEDPKLRHVLIKIFNVEHMYCRQCDPRFNFG